MAKFDLIKSWRNLPYDEKTSMINKITMVSNLIWAILKLILAFFIRSIFISLSGLYTIFIAFAKASYFDGRRHCKKRYEEHIYYNRISASLTFAGFLYTLYFLGIFFHPQQNNYDPIISIGIAAVAFCELFFSIWGLIKSKKSNDLLLTGLKFINLCSAMSSIVLTQIALLSVNYSEKSVIYNTITGTIVGFLTICISAYMFFSNKYKFGKIFHVLKVNKAYKFNMLKQKECKK